MQASTDFHWAAVKCILCHLQGTTSYGLQIIHSSSFTLHGFTDADWVGSIDDSKSTGSYLLFFGQKPISWKSNNQLIVVCSFIGAEYKALENGTTEVIWLQYLLTYLQIPFASTLTIWCDNIGVTYLFVNRIFHAHTRHVGVDYHFIRDRIVKKEIHSCFISSKNQLVDVFTKPLSTASFTTFRFKFRVDPPSSA
jgi:hypothetical protein